MLFHEQLACVRYVTRLPMFFSCFQPSRILARNGDWRVETVERGIFVYEGAGNEIMLVLLL